jgi:neutral ceramidase
MLQIGVAKADITAFKEGVGMLGYGIYYNIMESIETNLYSRAFVFKNEDRKVAFVNCEICFITPSVKRGVVKKLSRKYPELNYSDANVLLTAQHTHSGPGGYSYHGIYNMTSPGFVIEIYNKIVDGIVESIVEAEKNLTDCKIFIGKSEFAPEIPVGFQRSIKAYLQNPEARKISKDELHLGIDREMTLLKITSPEGKDIASVNWFGTHTTSLPNTNTKVCSDNKGYASQFFEETMKEKNPDFQAIFAQGTCGDVTPRFKYNKKLSAQRGKWEGMHEDDVESAKFNGQLQFDKAFEIYNSPLLKPIDNESVDFGLRYVDFSNIQVNPKYTGGKENIRTSPSCMGAAFLGGTYYCGPGMLEPLLTLTKGITYIVKWYEHLKAQFMPPEWGVAMRQKYAAQGAKHIVIETGEKRIMGTHDISNLIIPKWADDSIRNLKEFHARGALDTKPWTPQIMPLQIVKIGTIALAAFPFEITTIAGQRLKKTLEDLLVGKDDYTEVILCPYSNAYNGYITTPEEYRVQVYEGGHTVFGEWSLAALQTEFEKLALEMLKPKNERNLSNDVVPPTFTEEDLNKFAHFKSQYYIRTLKRRERIEQKKKNQEGRLMKRIDKLQGQLEKLKNS